MELGLKAIRNHYAERRLAEQRKNAESEARREIYPVCRMGEQGELINEIVVCGLPLFQVSNSDGRWNVKAEDVGGVIRHLRDAYAENYLKQ